MTMSPDREAIRPWVMAPAIALMATAALDIFVMLLAVGIMIAVMIKERDKADAVGVVLVLGMMVAALLRIGLSGLSIWGAWQMLQLRSHAWARSAGILAVIPCCYINPFLIAVGVWTLIVLSQPEVKAAFK
jgi:hypothetical protein